MKILTLDIETSPNIADVWGLFNQNVSLNQLREATRVMSFGAKWYDQPGVEFYSDYHNGHDEMIDQAWRLLDEADVVVHYNGTSFDIPHLRREFVLGDFYPPSPFKEVDLLRTVRKRFRFSSNKLDHVAQQLGLGSKVKHAGHELWVKCMAGDEQAWRDMKKYNIGDVRLTEQLYDRLLPWITGHPHHGLFSGEEHVCANCGGTELQKRGFAYTATSKFQQLSCNTCGAWSRGAKALERVDERGTA